MSHARSPQPRPRDLDPNCDLLESPDWLAVLLGRERPGSRARAARILAQHDLRELAERSAAELAHGLELHPAAAGRLVAALALARRLERLRRPARPTLRSAHRVAQAVRSLLDGRERETFLLCILDGKHRLKRTVRVSEGTLTTSLVHPREVFGPAIRETAAAIVVAHNHPSGDPEPSDEDLEVTRRLVRAGALLGIPLLDHVVLGDEGFVSIRERIAF